MVGRLPLQQLTGDVHRVLSIEIITNKASIHPGRHQCDYHRRKHDS